MTDSTDGLFGQEDDHPHDTSLDEVNYLEQLVGEGKKFKSAEDLAKGKAEADRYVTQLQQELAQLRKDLGTRITLEEFLERQNAKPSTTDPATPKPDAPGTDTVNPEVIQRLIQETLTQEQRKAIATQNLNSVKNTLEKEWGENFGKVLNEKAAELEVGKQFLDNLAATNPKAFLKLVGIEEKRDTYVPTPTSTVDAPRAPATGVYRTWSDYERLRKDNPKLYHTPRIQNEIHKRATTDVKFQEEIQAAYNRQRT